MNWDAVGAIAESIGALGVICSLVYLARQIRQSSNVTWSQNRHAHTQQAQAIMALQANPHLVAAIEKAYFTRAPLTTSDYILLEAYLLSSVARFQNEFEHYQKGLLSKEAWARRKSGFEAYLDADYAREWWNAAGCKYLEPELVKEVNEMLKSMRPGNYAADVMTELRSGGSRAT